MSQWQLYALNNQYNTLPISYPSITDNSYILIISYISADTIAANTCIEIYKERNCRYYIPTNYPNHESSSNIISIGY